MRILNSGQNSINECTIGTLWASMFVSFARGTSIWSVVGENIQLSVSVFYLLKIHMSEEITGVVNIPHP